MPKLKRRPDPYEKLRVLITGTMDKRGYSKATLGEKIGCTPPTMRDRLNHPETIKLGELSRIASALDIPSDEIRAALHIR